MLPTNIIKRNASLNYHRKACVGSQAHFHLLSREYNGPNRIPFWLTFLILFYLHWKCCTLGRWISVWVVSLPGKRSFSTHSCRDFWSIAHWWQAKVVLFGAGSGRFQSLRRFRYMCDPLGVLQESKWGKIPCIRIIAVVVSWGEYLWTA